MKTQKKLSKVIALPPSYLETRYAIALVARILVLNDRLAKATIKALPGLIATRNTELGFTRDTLDDDTQLLLALLLGQAEEAAVSFESIVTQSAIAAALFQNSRKKKVEAALVSKMALSDLAALRGQQGVFQTGVFKPSADLLQVDIFRQTPSLVPVVESWVSENTRLVKGLATKQVEAISAILDKGLKGGLGLKELTASIEAELGLPQNEAGRIGKKKLKNRARLIAADQMGTLNGQLSRQIDLSLGITEYEWITSNDQRVRPATGLKGTKTKRRSQKVSSLTNPSHRALEGKICRWDDPTVYKNPGETQWRSRTSIGAELLHPGQAIRCRCTSASFVEGF